MSDDEVRFETVPLTMGDRAFLLDLKPGDQVRRLIAGKDMGQGFTVERVEDGLIHIAGGWTFDTVYGAEVDEELGWDARKNGIVATWLEPAP